MTKYLAVVPYFINNDPTLVGSLIFRVDAIDSHKAYDKLVELYEVRPEYEELTLMFGDTKFITLETIIESGEGPIN